MKWKFCALVICLLITTTTGQVIDRVFWLWDSFPDIEWVGSSAANPVSGRIYFGEIEDLLQIFDPGALRKHGFAGGIDRITDIEPCPNAHRICAVDWDKTLLGYDDTEDTLVYRIDNFGRVPFVLQYNPLSNHLYVGDTGVIVIEPEWGKVIDTIPTSGGFVRRLAFDERHNYLFCTFWRGQPVEVIDCNSRTAIGTISSTEYTSDLMVHPTESKLYCLIGTRPNRQLIKVIDIDSLAVVESIPIPIRESWEEYGRLFLNRSLNRLYCLGMWDGIDEKSQRWWTWDTIAIIDISADTLFRMLELPEQEEDVRGAVVNQLTGKLYLACSFNDRVLVVGAGDSIVKSLPASWPTGVAWDSVHNRLCVGAMDEVLVVDGITDSIIHIEDYYGLRPGLMRWNANSQSLYIFNWKGIARINQDTLSHFTPFCYLTCFYAPYSEELNRYYVLGDTGNGQYVFVYDCGTDSIVAGFWHYGSTDFYLIPETHLLYARSETTRIYDIRYDSVIATKTFFPRIGSYDPHTGTTYGYYGNQIAVLNPRGDSVVRWVPLPQGIEDIFADTAAGNLWIPSDYYRLFIVFNCSTLQVIDSIRIPQSFRPVWVERDRKLYAFTEDTLLVISAAQRRITKRLAVPFRVGSINLIAYDWQNNRLYINQSERLLAIDCNKDSISWILPEVDFTCMELNPAAGEVYGAKRKKVTVIKDTACGIAEGGQKTNAQRILTTVVRNVLFLHTAPNVLLDITGRKVLDLKPGHNDIRDIAPGVYFVREATATTGVIISKIVIAD